MERFPSKRDSWLVGVLIAGFGISTFSLTASLLSPKPVPAGIGAVVSILVAAALFVAWIWTATDYTLTSSDLLVRCGPFRWRVPLAEIQGVNPTRNPLSSPALSLDRLEVVYGRGSVLMISPQDKNRFLRSLITRAPHLALRGDHVVRRG